MRLATYDKVRKFMGFDSGVHQEVIEAAIDNVTGAIAADIRCEDFNAASRTDLYYVTGAACLRFASEQYRTRLALSAGFVTSSVVVKWGPSPELVATNTITTGVLLNAEKGGVIVTGTDLRDCYVQVTYTAGFATEANPNQTTYLQSAVPEGLIQASILRAVSMLDAANPTLRHDDPAEASRASKELAQQASLLMAPYVRYFPSDLRPLG